MRVGVVGVVDCLCCGVAGGAALYGRRERRRARQAGRAAKKAKKRSASCERVVRSSSPFVRRGGRKNSPYFAFRSSARFWLYIALPREGAPPWIRTASSAALADNKAMHDTAHCRRAAHQTRRRPRRARCGRGRASPAPCASALLSRRFSCVVAGVCRKGALFVSACGATPSPGRRKRTKHTRTAAAGAAARCHANQHQHRQRSSGRRRRKQPHQHHRPPPLKSSSSPSCPGRGWKRASRRGRRAR